MRYKKYALFEFLDEINRHLITPQSIDIIKEVFVKQMKIIADNDGTQSASQSQRSRSALKSKKSKKSKKTKNKEEEEGNPETKIYYGIFNSESKIERYLELFAEQIRTKNDPENTDEIKKRRLDDSDLEPIEEEKPSPEELEKKELNEAQKQLTIHDTHFKMLTRKILFEKFKEMKIWCRQSFGQENKRIYLHMKFQGKRDQRHENGEPLDDDELPDSSRDRPS